MQDADDWLEELLVTEGLARFPNLRHLAIPSTSLITFPLLTLSALTSLDLSHNLLNEIPENLPASLVSLNVSHNLISSVRNANLGNIRSLNLSNNRIDCLAGLEGSVLERIDVRKNEIGEQGEIGRLAVVPIKAVWCSDNALTHEQDWRIKLGTTFAAEGKDVVVDDAAWTWGERRAIDARLAARGYLSRRESVQPVNGERVDSSTVRKGRRARVVELVGDG